MRHIPLDAIAELGHDPTDDIMTQVSVRLALEQLGEVERELLLLVAEGVSLRQAARELQLRLRQARAMLDEATARMRELLSDVGDVGIGTGGGD
mgnify:CR=1 FL=1